MCFVKAGILLLFMMDTDSVEQQSHSNFDHVRLSEEQSDGSVADVEDDPSEIPKTKVIQWLKLN